MLKANTKTLFFFVLTISAFFLFACSNPEKERLNQIKTATELSHSGDFAGALAILENLSTQYPNDTEILRQIGEIYQAQNNATMAAFYLSEAYRQNPQNVELLYQAYRAQETAGDSDSALRLLETLSEMDPASMGSTQWVRLGELRAEANRYEPALQAYLKGVNPDKETPAPKTSAAIGDLFIKLNNLPLAERWFTLAADSNDPNALTALFGLLEINLRNRNWEAAELNMKRLDAQFPGALDASEWSQARTELQRWRAAQEKMKAELAKSRKVKEATTQEAEVAAVTVIDVPAKETSNDSVDTAAPTEDTSTNVEGKAQIIEDMEHAEAMADAPAIEAESENAPDIDADATATEPKVIAYDPSISIQPAEPDLGIGVTYDQQSQGADTSIRVSNENTPAPAIEPTPLPARPAPVAKTINELLSEADMETLELNHKAAIRKYWQALGQNNQRADIWNNLSKAYAADGQIKNAETTALEATRLAPREIDYTLDYLRVIQRSKNQTDFLAELETAYARFPRSPEIALSLARAYDRVAQNPVAAATYYNRFIELAPNHPLRAEAETALQRAR